MEHLILMLIITLLVAGPLQADVIQWSKGYTAKCDNATEREDGTPLPPEEIDMVIYYISEVYGDIDNAIYTVIMDGGCKDTFIDTKSYVPHW